MKKTISIGLMSLIGYSYALDIHDHRELTEEQKYEFFTKEGLPVPGSGVNLVPGSSMAKSITEKMNKNALSISKKGYIEEENSSAALLIKIKELSASDLRANLDNHNPKSTHMRANAKEVHAGYDYNGISSDLVSQVIGFSAQGAYIEDKGWTGAIEFFEPNEIPETTCSYSQSNLKLTGGSANIAQEIVSHDVNKKLSIVEVIGNKESAFGYTVEWYDPNYRHILLCAQKEYSQETINKVVELAKKIDLN